MGMDVDITQRRSKELVGREELDIEVEHTGEATPTREDVRRTLAAELDEDPRAIEVVGIHSSSGLPTSTGTVYIHDEPVMDGLEDEEEETGEADEEPDGEDEDGGGDDADESETD
ncbi:MAG: hypothetical protein ABEK12_00880 [Candidatus Nanohaloarchaea archaeon]